jgi:uncharacterized protein (DUF1330 family)
LRRRAEWGSSPAEEKDMKTRLTALAASLWLMGCASAPVPAPEAASVPNGPNGYVIVEIQVTNPEAYEGYKAAVAPLVAAAGGRYLVRGGKAEGREGAPPAGRIVVLEYPSFDAAKAFLDSPEYGAIVQLRANNTVSRLMIVEGTAP